MRKYDTVWDTLVLHNSESTNIITIIIVQQCNIYSIIQSVIG